MRPSRTGENTADPNSRATVDRGDLIRLPHVARLNAFADANSRLHGPVPYFDPLDGGQNARLLILLESPGPSTATLRYVSRDNPSPTQRNLARFLADAHIPRRDTVLWNTIPWVLRIPGVPARALRRSVIDDGIRSLTRLLPLLPHVQCVVLAGRIAERAAPTLLRQRPGLLIEPMPHPSPLSVCTSPAVTREIAAVLSKVARRLGGG